MSYPIAYLRNRALRGGLAGKRKRNAAKGETPIIGSMPDGTPIIQCTWRKNSYQMLKFWCSYCQKEHLHGQDEGYRGSHCDNPESPLYGKDYFLKEPAEAEE